MLPDTTERMMASSVTARWTYPTGKPVPAASYAPLRARVKGALLAAFTGPPDAGEYSPGVQNTLHKMGLKVLEAAAEVEQITLNMPNIHYLPAKVSVPFVKPQGRAC